MKGNTGLTEKVRSRSKFRSRLISCFKNITKCLISLFFYSVFCISITLGFKLFFHDSNTAEAVLDFIFFTTPSRDTECLFPYPQRERMKIFFPYKLRQILLCV